MTRLEDYDISNAFKARVLKSERITPEDYDEEIRNIALRIERDDFKYEIGQSIGVVAPGPKEVGSPRHLRLYSIAGDGGEEKSVQICVKRVFYIDEYNGERYPGIASNYLCDLKEGDPVTITGPYGSPFQIPEENSAGILMIGMGTGIAPFRAFVRHIYGKYGGWKGPVRLFYGAKTGLELVYMNDRQNDFANYYDEETFKAFEAVSPRPHFDEPVALEEALEKNGAEVWELLLKPDTHVYVAGLETVREMLDRAFSRIAGSPDKWRKRQAELKAGGRWSEIIY